jgi:putative oxidoreductase
MATDRFAMTCGDLVALLARLAIGWLFLHYGWMKLTNMAGTVGYLTNLGIPNPSLWYWPAAFGELIIGIGLILGVATRYVSLFTVVYLIIATAIAHRWWAYPAAQQGAQYANFCKNVGLMGGALLLFWAGGGRYSLDNWLRERSG